MLRFSARSVVVGLEAVVLLACGCGGSRGTGSCPEGQTSCNGACADTQVDRGNCGACGTVCPTGYACTNGSCVCGGAPCADNRLCCNNACTDQTTDNNNCGYCGNQCQGGATCQNGLSHSCPAIFS